MPKRLPVGLKERPGRDHCPSAVVAGNDCETFWDKDQLTDSCYQFNFQSTLSWREAWASCEQQGADLLSITEIHEQTYINGEAWAAPWGWAGVCHPGVGTGCQQPETCSPGKGPVPSLLVWGQVQGEGGLEVGSPFLSASPVPRAPHWL